MMRLLRKYNEALSKYQARELHLRPGLPEQEKITRVFTIPAVEVDFNALLISCFLQGIRYNCSWLCTKHLAERF